MHHPPNLMQCLPLYSRVHFVFPLKLFESMASSRVLSRLLTPTTLSRIVGKNGGGGAVRQFWHHHHRKNLPEQYIGPISNVIERVEKEFERMQQQFNNFFQDIKNNRPLTNPSAGQGNDMIITESDGTKKFHLSLNVGHFEPEEIKIKTENGFLTISAKIENKLNSNYSLHAFSQTFALPKEVKIDDLKSTYTENGILSIEASLQKKDKPKEDRQIKIERI